MRNKIAKIGHVISTSLGGGKPLCRMSRVGLIMFFLSSMILYMSYCEQWELHTGIIIALSVTGALGLLLDVVGLVRSIRRQERLKELEDSKDQHHEN